MGRPYAYGGGAALVPEDRALAAVFPEAHEQRCWNQALLNVLEKLLFKLQADARSLLTKIPRAATREEGGRSRLSRRGVCSAATPRSAAGGIRTGSGW